MLKINNIEPKTRLKSLLYDYLFILIYLLVLFVIMMSVYFIVFKKVPQFSEWDSQLIATFTSVIPIILIFSIMDYMGGSFGKRKLGLKLYYQNKTFLNSLIRNIVKFLPWQIGHISTIHGIYTEYDLIAIILSVISISSLIVMLLMGLYRKDKRHIGDLLAKTQVQR